MLSVEEIVIAEQKAKEFRERMGVPDDEKVDMTDLLRRMKFAGEISNVIYATIENSKGSIAHFDPGTDTITVSAVSAERQTPRDRFTFAHEIAHKIAAHRFVRHRKNGPQFGAQVRMDEEYANAIAAAILVPEHLANVTEETTAEDISRRFGVSMPMAKLRLIELQRRYRTKFGIARKLPTRTVPVSFDTGSYDEAMAEMASNTKRWNSR